MCSVFIRNVWLIDSLKRIKAQHINNSKIYLSKGGSKILSGLYFENIAAIFRCYLMIQI